MVAAPTNGLYDQLQFSSLLRETGKYNANYIMRFCGVSTKARGLAHSLISFTSSIFRPAYSHF